MKPLPWSQLSHMDAADITALQHKKFRAFIRHQLMYAPYYRQMFKDKNLSVSDFNSLDDLKKIPFSSKEDLAPSDADRARPRGFILQPDEKLVKKYAPKSELVRILAKKLAGHDVKAKLEWEYKPIHFHFTTGRTALPTPFSYSARDLEMLKESGKRMLDVSGVTKDEVAINAFPYSPHLAFWLAYYAMVATGMTALPTGGGKVMGTAKIIDSMERLKANVLTVIPGYCYHLLRQAAADKRDFSAMRHIILGGERVSSAFRDKARELMAVLGAPEVQILATYAMTEGKTAWIQCAENTGYHLYPDLEYFEVINEEGQAVPEGPGELVYTALDWRGSVVVRYRTGDRTAGIERGACPNCGKTVPRILPDIQRSSDVREFQLTKVKGELVNLNNFYPLLSGVKELDEWQVELGKVNNDPFEVDRITIFVTPKPGVDMTALQPKLIKAVEEAVNVGVEIQALPLSELLDRLGMETELKEKRIIDNRPKS